jgi:hypothetical protein
MITPAYGLSATSYVLPRMALDFTTATLDPRITFTRSNNTATYINSSGVITAINANLPRFDFDPVTLLCKGLLLEESRTNLLLNSLIDGTSLSTQSVSVTAQAYTLSFYGTGQIVLSGTSSATVTGTGAYPSQRTYTFTPTAGTLTLTVTGTVQYAQLEAGSFGTSFIPTAGTSVLRSADSASMTGTNFSSWYNASEGAFIVEYTYGQKVFNSRPLAVSDNTTSNFMELVGASGGGPSAGFGGYWSGTVGGSATLSTNNGVVLTAAAGQKRRFCGAYKLNNFASSVNANNLGSDTSSNVPTVDRLYFGSSTNSTASILNGCVGKVFYYPQRLTDAEVRAFSKI